MLKKREEKRKKKEEVCWEHNSADTCACLRVAAQQGDWVAQCFASLLGAIIFPSLALFRASKGSDAHSLGGPEAAPACSSSELQLRLHLGRLAHLKSRAQHANLSIRFTSAQGPRKHLLISGSKLWDNASYGAPACKHGLNVGCDFGDLLI